MGFIVYGFEGFLFRAKKRELDKRNWILIDQFVGARHLPPWMCSFSCPTPCGIQIFDSEICGENLSLLFSSKKGKKVKEELRDPNNNISNELESIARGPNPDIFKYEGYDVNGHRYHTKTRDDKRVNQHSGVSVVDDGEGNTYYGVISEIWLIDYHLIRVPVFKCDWVHSRGIETDDLGFIPVDFGRLGYKEDPFIMASHAKQVFYVRDQKHSRPSSKWSIVMSTREREVGGEEVQDDSLALDGNPTFENVLPDEGSADADGDSQSAYRRDNGDGVWIADFTKEVSKKRKRSRPLESDTPADDDSSTDEDGSSSGDESSMEIDSDED